MRFCTKGFFCITFIVLFTLLTQCGANLHEATLSNALLNESYSYSLIAKDDSWRLWGNSDIVFSHTAGTLPEGVVIGSNGTITGIPTELGNYEFRVTAYAIDDNWGDSWYNDSDDDVTRDSEWYTLFVTEASTNENCPSPDDENTTELYICLGTIEKDTLAEQETIDLDVTYFIGFDNAKDYKIKSVSFSITYDEKAFFLDPNDLTSQRLREAATRTNATIDFDQPEEGFIEVTVTGVDKELHKSGRLLDLPFYALQNMASGDYDFTIAITDIESNDSDLSLPTSYEVDGSVNILEDIVEEETDEETEEDVDK